MALIVPALLATVACVATALPAHAAQHTYANPVDIDYRYNFEQLNERISYRTGADPVIVRHGDAYYLFQTLADGYWRSTDLVHWRFVTPSRWPFDSEVAPAAISDGGKLVLMQSAFGPRPLLASDAPETGRLDFLTRLLPAIPTAVPPGQDLLPLPAGKTPPGPWDPGLFVDDDGQWYLYWGSSDRYPLYGIALDREDGFAFRGTPTPMLRLDPAQHGWERFGPDHLGASYPDGKPIVPFLEGAWMNKVGGRYYLQYGAPGTEYNVYATGVYVGTSPLSAFAYAPYNPVGYKPGGFATGAGHGSTFQGPHGNWWNTGTAWLGANWTFERRIMLFPAAFHADGQMRVVTRFGDFPQRMPDGPVDDPASLFTGWMLLSYRKPAVASSTDGARVAAFATDEDMRTWWTAARNAPGETLAIDLGATKTVRAVQVNFSDDRAGRYGDAPDIYTTFRLQQSADGRHWTPLAQVGSDRGPDRRDRANAYVELPAPVRTRYVRYVHGHIGGAHLAISDLRVFGNADGPPPPAPRDVRAVRDADPRNATVQWKAVPGAVGYNVRWGIRRDRLDSTYQVFADRGTKLELRALNIGVAYDVSVEAFDERGVSPLGAIVHLD